MSFIQQGGWFTLPILLLGLSSITLIIVLPLRRLNHQKINRKTADAILLFGSLSLAIGFFAQILGIFQAAGYIQTAEEISPSLIWGGMKVSIILLHSSDPYINTSTH